MTPRMFRTVAWALVFAALLGGTRLNAQNRNGTAASSTRGHGYTLVTASGWAMSQGYRPVRVELRAGTVAGEDREYTIEIEVRDAYGWERTTTRDRLVIPANARSGSAVITVPQAGAWGTQTVHVIDGGGRTLEKLDAYSSSSPNPWSFQGGLATFPSFLHISDRSVNTAMLNEAFGLASGVNNVVNMGLSTNTVDGRPQYPSELFQQIAPAELSARWINYSSADVVCISTDHLANLAKTQPEVVEAIAAYVSAGGNLWVWNAGENWERLAEIEELTKLWGPSEAGWTKPSDADFRREIDGAFMQNRAVDYTAGPMGVSEVVDTNNTGSTPRSGKPIPEVPFQLRDAQLGRVLAFRAEEPLSKVGSVEDTDNLVWALNANGSNRLLGKRRQGMSLTDDNPDFWKLMIPGVGKAPVTAFRVLITVFVIAIGPINYYFLRRRRKLHLLLAVVPVTAIVVTACLFAYALLTDGLHSRVRPRTFTSIDQQRQHAATWSRTTYYSGLSPAGGLRFAGDTIVLPIEAEASQGYGSPVRTVNWQGDQQQFASGWLYSRTPTQFMSIRSRPTTRGLRIKPATDGGAPTVTNALGTTVLQLLLCDEQGRLYHAGSTASGAACTLKPVAGDKAIGDATRFFAERAAVMMPDMQLTDIRSLSTRRYVYYNNAGSFTPQQYEGLLEVNLSKAEAWFRDPKLMPPRHYVAIVEQSPEVDYGLENPVQEMPLHVIHGTW